MSRRTSPRSPKTKRAPKRVSAWLWRALVLGAVAIVARGVWTMLPQPDRPPIEEAQLALEKGRAARAEQALFHATRLDPHDVEAWLLRLELLRLEDRQIEAQRVGWDAYAAVHPSSRSAILKAMTLALLADAPDALARDTLARWVAADPSDIDARVAMLRRIAAAPHADDPLRAARLEALAKLVADHPEHAAAREALALALADSGEPDRGRAVLESWPAPSRDARYHRLAGRWALEFDHEPARAVDSLRSALEELPHDWRTRYRLARALSNAGRLEEADRAAVDVERLREALDPVKLGPRLDRDLADLNDPSAVRDLAALCQRVGLARLADAWRRDSADERPRPKSAP